MARRPSPEPDDPEQFQRFLETAKELGVDESPEAFDRVFEKVVPPEEPPKRAKPSR